MQELAINSRVKQIQEKGVRRPYEEATFYIVTEQSSLILLIIM